MPGAEEEVTRAVLSLALDLASGDLLDRIKQRPLATWVDELLHEILSGSAEPDGYGLLGPAKESRPSLPDASTSALVESKYDLAVICSLLGRLVHKLCASFSPADRDVVYGRILLRLLDKNGERLHRIRDPACMPKYVKRLVENERARLYKRVRRTVLVPPESFLGDSAGPVESHNTSTASHTIRSMGDHFRAVSSG